MAHEISEFNIADRQLLAAAVHARAGNWTEIGEARVIRTLFGGARVRVIREQDQIRRMWLYAALVAAMMVAVAWQVWITLQQNEDAQSNVPQPLSIRVSPPKFEPAYGPSVREAESRHAALPMDSIPRPATVSPGVNRESPNTKSAAVPAQPPAKSPLAAKAQATAKPQVTARKVLVPASAENTQHVQDARSKQAAAHQQVKPAVPVQTASQPQPAPVAHAPAPAQPAAVAITHPVQAAPAVVSHTAEPPPAAKTEDVFAAGLSDPLIKPSDQPAAPAAGNQAQPATQAPASAAPAPAAAAVQ